MKLQTSNSSIEFGTQMQTSNFSIAMNGKAFKVLSDTLYTDKIGSMIRELSCNAYDSHVAAGKKEVPFEIHLPDALEPWFSVKDFGTGLSEEDVQKVFCVFFKSTKEESNDSIGCFGLGSKTPFSYTDQFTITSVYNGTKTVYSAFISQEGIPAVMKMQSQPTSDSNGVEIKVSVKEKDFYAFSAKANGQLAFFEVPPVVLNNTFKVQVGIAEKPAISCNTISIYNNLPGRSGVFIVQGNVGYPIHNFSDFDEDTQQFFRWRWSSSTFVLKFNIGEIGVTASREAVEMNASTIANIQNRVKQAKSEILDNILNQIKNLSSDFERVKLLNEVNNAFSHMMTNKGSTIPNLIKQHYPCIDTLDNNWRTFFLRIPALDGKVLSAQEYSFNKIRRDGRPSFAGVYWSAKTLREFMLMGNADTRKFVVRSKKRASSGLLSVIQAGDNTRNVVMLEPAEGISPKQLHALLKVHLPSGFDVSMDSDYKVPRAKSSGTRSYHKGAYYYSLDTADRSHDWRYAKTIYAFIKKTDVTELDEQIYMLYDDIRVTDNQKELLYKLLQLKGLQDIPEVIMIPSKYAEIAEDLQSVEEYIKEMQQHYESLIDEEVLKKQANWAKNWQYLQNTLSHRYKVFAIALASYAALPDCTLKDAATEIKERSLFEFSLQEKDEIAEHTRMKDFCNYLPSFEAEVSQELVSATKIVLSFITQHPLLTQGLNYGSIDSTHLLKYTTDMLELQQLRAIANQQALVA